MSVILHSLPLDACTHPDAIDWLNVTLQNGVTPAGEGVPIEVMIDGPGAGPAMRFRRLCRSPGTVFGAC